MRKTSYFFLINNTYSRDILLFLQEKCSSRIIPVTSLSDLHSNEAEWLLLTPWINCKDDSQLDEIPSKLKIAFILDWNFDGFEDYGPLISNNRIDLILSPFKIKNIRIKNIPSLHGLMIKQKVKISAEINRSDYLFCSQPLKEDRTELNFNQYELMQEALLIAKRNNAKLYVKRHPREISDLPKELANDRDLRIWSGTAEEALSMFSNWIGHNSILLFDALALGHDVVFLRYEPKI